MICSWIVFSSTTIGAESEAFLYSINAKQKLVSICCVSNCVSDHFWEHFVNSWPKADIRPSFFMLRLAIVVFYQLLRILVAPGIYWKLWRFCSSLGNLYKTDTSGIFHRSFLLISYFSVSLHCHLLLLLGIVSSLLSWDFDLALEWWSYPQYIKMLEDVCRDSITIIRLHKKSWKFSVGKGVRQGSTLSHNMFSGSNQDIEKLDSMRNMTKFALQMTGTGLDSTGNL